MILVVVGPGGAGKGTVIRRLVERAPRLVLSRSWTTRAPRPGETEDDYAFVDRATFLERAKSGGFLEWATVLGEYYGTPLPELAAGQDLVLEIDVQGAEQVLERVPEAWVVLLVPPSRQEQEARLRSRGDPEEQIEKRLALGDHEIELGRRIARRTVVNDDVEQAVGELASIIEEARRSA